jgi:hypothetical protein
VFRKIGQFEIAAEGDLILVWSSPEFNLESAQEYAAAMAVVIDTMPSAFGVLARFDEPPIMGPEVEASIRESARQRAQRGMVAVAFVAANGPGHAIASGQWDRIYKPIGVPFAFFHDPASARSWLREQIIAADRTRDQPDPSVQPDS